MGTDRTRRVWSGWGPGKDTGEASAFAQTNASDIDALLVLVGDVNVPPPRNDLSRAADRSSGRGLGSRHRAPSRQDLPACRRRRQASFSALLGVLAAAASEPHPVSDAVGQPALG